MSIELGMPPVPPAPLAERRLSRQIMVGSVPVGGGAPVSVQSMTTTLTANVNATLQQIAELTASGCQIVRVAVPSQDDAEALPAIAKKSQIPVIADIHFQPKYVFAAIEAGCAAVRVNPGNIKQFDDKVAEIARAAGDAGIPIRIGVNAGSLDKRLLAKYGKATPEALVESALWECSLFEEHGFRDIKISVKHHDPVVMINAYRQLARQCDYPLHLGVTEAGPAFQGTVKSAVAFGALLAEGIGDTIRVSLSAPPVEEVKVGISILESLGMRQRGLEIVSCPSCGRAQVDVYKLAEEVTAGLEGMEVPLRVAVMGCVVNGPGEAREADLGVASGNGKGQIFVRGKVIATVPESQIVETLIEEAMRLAEQGAVGPRGPRASRSSRPTEPLVPAPAPAGRAASGRLPRHVAGQHALRVDDLAGLLRHLGPGVGGQHVVGDEHVHLAQPGERAQADQAPLGVVGQHDDAAGDPDQGPVGLRFGQVRRGQPGVGVEAVAAEEEQVEVERPDGQVGHRPDQRVRGGADAAGQHDRVGRAVEAAGPAEQVGHPQRVRDDGEPGHVEQALGQRERGRPGGRSRSRCPA